MARTFQEIYAATYIYIKVIDDLAGYGVFLIISILIVSELIQLVSGCISMYRSAENTAYYALSMLEILVF